MENKKLTMTIPEAAEALGISRATAYQLANSGKLPAIRISTRRFVIPVKSLLEMLDSTTLKKVV